MNSHTENIASLQEQLRQQRRLLDSYLDLASDMSDDDAYVARGNGFCDTKYSDDFLQGQITSIRKRIQELEERLAK